MSTSIHMHIEVKKDGQWQHYSAPSMLREGQFFDLLAGIYGIDTPVVPVKGLPNDMSGITQYCYEMDSESYCPHHQGWLSSAELRLLQQRLRDLNPAMDPFDVDLEGVFFHCYINGNAVSSHQGFEDSRLIFWFDN